MLLASAPTKASLLKLIERFYCGQKMLITDDNRLQRVSDGAVLSSVVVRKRRGRYSFEAVEVRP